MRHGITRRHTIAGMAFSATVSRPIAADAQGASQRSASELWSSIGRLERDAAALRLPAATISRGLPSGPVSASNVYFESLPRLVALQERATASANAADLARRTANLLSELNASERSSAEALGGTRGKPPPSFAALKPVYTDLWKRCEVRPKFQKSVGWHIGVLRRYQPRYKALSAKVGVPWQFIGVLHALEASFNFGGHLHNGDPLTARTFHVPSGMPKLWLPPSDWESSATDALKHEGFLDQADWSTEMILYRLERYNGFGYRRRDINSPYLWSFSNNYTAGKFASDGVYDPHLISQQCGAAVLLKQVHSLGYA